MIQVCRPRIACLLAAAFAALLFAVACLPASSARAEETLPRKIIALYDSAEDRSYADTRLHNYVQMPLNHLGLVVIPHDIRTGLPSDEMMQDARGIVTWFSSTPVEDPQAFLSWLDRHMANGVRLAVLGDIGFRSSALGAAATRQLLDRVMARIGIKWRGEWVSMTYGLRISAADPAMTGFERPYPPTLPSYIRVGVVGPEAKSYLSVTRDGQSEPDDLVVIGTAGGYIAANYATVTRETSPRLRAWYVNPFFFFRAAFATDGMPKPDTTTLSGRRMFYSHIDGDGWHNVATLQRYRDRRLVSAEVVYEQVIQGYADLPVTVGPISGDLEDTWYGNEEARELARRIFEQPNVEAGSHTHSHPFAWTFFRNYKPEAETPFLRMYPPRPGKSLAYSVYDPEAVATRGPPPAPIDGVYERPRSYAVRPFSLEEEIAGSIRIIEALLPPGKKVAVMQWSGNTEPWDRVLSLTRQAGVRNINGGDPRMDGTYDSYAWASPLARRVGNQWQVYTSGANENIYTDNWRRRFYAYRFLIDSLRNMEQPIRIKPINVYYHFYLAERDEGLSSLLAVLDYVRTQNVAPVETSRFASIVDGAMSARVVTLSPDSWRIENRDGLETVRFDYATQKSVDFARSTGVLGQRHHQGSLYIALDGAVAAPVIALKDHPNPHLDPEAAIPYLVEARWRVEALTREGAGLRFRATGFGPGDFVWKMPAPGRFTVEAKAGDVAKSVTAEADNDGLLRFTLAVPGEHGVDIQVRPTGASQ